MGKFTGKREWTTIKVRGKMRRIKLLSKENFDKFNPSILGLGNIGLPSKEVEAIAAVFDLSGFTNFCSQVDPHLAVPEYLSRFLDWLFNEVKEEFIEKNYKQGKKLWSELPFLAKFLGDGVLFLWDAHNMSKAATHNVVIVLNNICVHYLNDFYPEIKREVSESPQSLRCGIARGKVYSVGNRQDYVGPCINIASRLVKLPGITFCVSRKGININENPHKHIRELFVEKCIRIKGVGESELVWLLKGEFKKIPTEEKKLFREP